MSLRQTKYSMRNLLFTLLTAQAVVAQTSLNISLLDQWQDNSLPVNFYNARFNEVWGFVHQGEEYAVIGSTEGTHIFRLTATNQLEEVDFVEGKEASSVVIHRDYHDYNGYLYAVCDEGSSSLQIMDLSYLPDSVHLVYDSDQLIIRAHNIFIDTARAKLYALALTQPGPLPMVPLGVFDLTNPVAPVKLQDWGTMGEVGHVHDAFVTNDTAYLNCGPDGFWVVNFGGSVPVVNGVLLNYPDKGYNHSGWLSPDRQTYIMADENWGHTMKSLDVSDLTNITVLDTFLSGNPADAIPHNQMIRGNDLYVAHYHEGLRWYDMSDPSNIVEIGYFDTYSGSGGFGSYQGAWGVYALLPSGRILASDMTNGLFLFQPGGGFSAPELHLPSWFLGPNPVSNYLNVVLETPDHLELYSLTGQPVRTWETQTSGKHTLSFAGLPAGTYILRAAVAGNGLRVVVR